MCPPVALINNLCTKCNTNYYPKEIDSKNLGEYINCYNGEQEGYYLDNNLYKKCYDTCKKCNIGGNNENHNCIECKDSCPFQIIKDDYINCYKNCSNYYYFDNEYNFYCTNDLSCPNEYKLKENSMECIQYADIDNLINDILNNEKNSTEKSKEEEIKFYDNILKNIEESFTSKNFDTSNIDNGDDKVLKTEKLTITFTTSDNQKNNINKNMTTIDLGECETLLRNHYNLTNNETLYMKKIDIVQEGMKALKVEYDVYCKLFGTNLIKLNLTVCGKSKVSISIPVVINDHLDKLNSSSGYYNDICYTTTSEDGTDISLKDRQTDYVDNDKVVCQDGCDFTGYDYDNCIAKCSCKVKESSSSVADMSIDKGKLLENFKDIKNIVNFDFLICYKKLFKKESFVNNIGCFIILGFILFHILIFFIFSIISFPKMKKRINKIASKINEQQPEKENEIKEKNIFENNEIFIYKNKRKRRARHTHIDNKKSTKDSHIKININSNIIINNQNKKEKKDKIEKNEKKEKKDKKEKKEKKEKEENKIRIENYIDEEINGLSYYFALKFDKRTYWQYYVSLIKTQHNLICALFNNRDYNSGIVKIDLYLVGFAIEYTVNALFYNDDTMHKIYESKGQFDLETQIPIIVYSSIISYILNWPLNFLALSNDIIINFKQDNTKINIAYKAKKLIKILTIKFTLYFIISFLFLLFFWYYISMFGVIYRNTQFHLLKDILMSLGLSLLIPFVVYLIPGIFRIPALSHKKNKRVCLYNFSKLLQGI